MNIHVNKWEFNYECGQWVLYRNGEPYEWIGDVLPEDVPDVWNSMMDTLIDSIMYTKEKLGSYWN